MEEVEIVEKESEVVDWVYWSVSFPFPFSSRDYLYKRQSKTLGECVYFFKCTAADHASRPVISSRVRVEDFEMILVLKGVADNNSSTWLFMNYFADFKMSIPTYLYNWVTKTGVPEYWLKETVVLFKARATAKRKKDFSRAGIEPTT